LKISTCVGTSTASVVCQKRQSWRAPCGPSHTRQTMVLTTHSYPHMRPHSADLSTPGSPRASFQRIPPCPAERRLPLRGRFTRSRAPAGRAKELPSSSSCRPSGHLGTTCVWRGAFRSRPFASPARGRCLVGCAKFQSACRVGHVLWSAVCRADGPRVVAGEDAADV
jgi:hypothetical protein